MDFPSPSPSPRPLRSSKTVNAIPLPSLPFDAGIALEDDALSEKMTSRNFLLEVQFQELGQKIIPLFSILGKTVPGSQLEKIFMSKSEDTDEKFTLTPAAIKEAEILLETLSAQVLEKKSIAQKLWSEISELWVEVESKEELQLTFTNSHIKIIEALKFLKTEYVNRKAEKGQRVTQFILELRSEIAEIWNQCLISENEKQQFAGFHSSVFTEDLLGIHKEELNKWKIYHDKNQAVLDMMKQRQDMWKRLRELEARSADPTRFVNRGGSLLKDQKDLASIMKALPKLENELRRLAVKFEGDHGRKVTIFGQDICTLIDLEWTKFNEEKQTKKFSSRAKTRQSLMPPPPPKQPEKRPAQIALLTPTPKRKCQNPTPVANQRTPR